ncbi:MAG: hypothetical protein E4H13_10090, partial [Calditrichales bacterium]
MNIRWIIYISIISVLIWAELPAEIWQQTSYGRYTVIRMVHSPFPDSAYTDPAFQDSSVYIFVPRGYQKKAYYDLVIDHHGFGAIVDPANREKTSYPESFRQDYQLFTSGKNAILIMPQAARNAANGATGKFGRMGGFQRFIEEIGTFLKHEEILNMNASLRDIHISSFSGGYQIMAMDITLNPPEFLTHIRSVNLWDSFYGYR